MKKAVAARPSDLRALFTFLLPAFMLICLPAGGQGAD